MRTFNGFNQIGEDKCPICGTNDDKETVLIPIAGTQNGSIVEAKQFHLKCLELWYDEEEKIIYQRFGVD